MRFLISSRDLLLACFANGFFGEVPFVNHNDARLLVLDDDIRNFFVLFGNARFGVEHQHRDVAARNRIFASLRAKEFNGVGNTPGFAESSSIDEQIALSPGLGLNFKWNVDRIARGPWHGAHDDSLRLGQRIDDGRFADIGSAHNCQFQRLALGYFFRDQILLLQCG